MRDRFLRASAVAGAVEDSASGEAPLATPWQRDDRFCGGVVCSWTRIGATGRPTSGRAAHVRWGVLPSFLGEGGAFERGSQVSVSESCFRSGWSVCSRRPAMHRASGRLSIGAPSDLTR